MFNSHNKRSLPWFLSYLDFLPFCDALHGGFSVAFKPVVSDTLSMIIISIGLFSYDCNVYGFCGDVVELLINET